MELKPPRTLESLALVLGAIVRLALIALVTPWTYLHWFIPFLTHVGSHLSGDPWTSFLVSGGDPIAFPYGPLYILVFGPAVALGQAIGSAKGAAVALGLVVLCLDVLLFLVLRRMAPANRRSWTTYAYWTSPVVIYVCYWHGQLDVLPVLVLASALLLLSKRAFGASGLVLGAAVAAKLSMAVAVPFAWIYVVGSRRLRRLAPRHLLMTLAGLATLAPFAFSPGFRQMVFKTPESLKVFALRIGYGDGLAFYVLPLVIAGMIYGAWRIRRFTFDTLFCMAGAAFFVLFLLTPAAPGWALWLMPFMVIHLCRTGAGGWALAAAFSGLFVVFHLTSSTGAVMVGGLDLTHPFNLPALMASGDRIRNLLLSVYLAAGGAFVFRMLGEGVFNDPFYRFTRKPLVIGIAGDSGAGKDTLADALALTFGASSTAMVSGDDYHLWDRHKPMWRALTHLNPRANNLRRFSNDVLALAQGRAVRAPHYDHRSGRMTKPRLIPAADVVVALGLHALHGQELLAAYGLKIFLAMDESLRRYFKIRRDVVVRGHSIEAVMSSLDKRAEDSRRYIQPQAAEADLILTLEPTGSSFALAPLTSGVTPTMRLRIQGPVSSELSSLARVLLAIGGLQVTEIHGEASRPTLTVEGAPTAADIAAALRALGHNLDDLLALEPRWAEGLTGVMQLAALDQIGQMLSRPKG